MRKVFVDTAAWIALRNTKDTLHQQAISTMQELRADQIQLITSEFIFLEIADGFANSPKRDSITDWVNQLRQMPTLTCVPLSQTLLNDAWTLYSQYSDKEWGLTDCTSFVIMKQQDISVAFTSDKHFEQAGFLRWLKP